MPGIEWNTLPPELKQRLLASDETGELRETVGGDDDDRAREKAVATAIRNGKILWKYRETERKERERERKQWERERRGRGHGHGHGSPSPSAFFWKVAAPICFAAAVILRIFG